jgi:ParB/RepB/Spo0J family partition protein
MRRATSDDLRLKMQGLLGSTQGEREVEGALLLVDIERVHATEQPRQTFAPDEMSQLVASIRELHEAGQGVAGTGILQPILVRPRDAGGDGYFIKAGERRYRAAREVGLEQVPVVVQPEGEEDAFEHALIENIIRHDLSPLEEGDALARLMERRSYSVRDAAKRLGKSKSYVTDRLEVRRAGEDVRAMVSARADTLRHAREIDKVSDPALRAELIRATVEDDASFKAIQERIAQGATSPAKKEAKADATPMGDSNGSSSTSKDEREFWNRALRESVRPAQTLLAQAVQQIEGAGTRTSGASRRELKREVAALKGHVERLEQILKEAS